MEQKEQNEILRQIIETIRKDIVTDKKFLDEVLKKIKLRSDNIPHETIQIMMSTLNKGSEMRKPVSNRPKDLKGTKAAKPVAFGKNTAQIVSDLLNGNNVYLTGKAGTGKTYLAETIAEYIMGQPYFMINCSQWTSPIEIRGGQTIEGYKTGQLIKAWAQGGILILDELPKLDPNTAGLLNAALAKSADQPSYDEDGNIIESTIPHIVDGKGDKIYKGQDAVNEDHRFRFAVIGTGNTDMMNVGNKYGGNQRQDYSLVDRFAGSFYTIEEDPILEQSLTYTYVFSVCDAIRKFLNTGDFAQSISLRTMLNFNRTFEQQMLDEIDSPFADEIYDNNGDRVKPKTISDSLNSFINMMEKNQAESLRNFPAFRTAESTFATAQNNFELEFKRKYHLNPITGSVLTEEEIQKLS